MTVRTCRRLIVAMTALCALAATSPVAAQTTTTVAAPPKFAIAPTSGGSFFTIEGIRGQTKTVEVRVRNAGSATANARTYVADAFTTVNGGLGAKLFGEPKTGTAAWITYPDETIPLDAGAEVQRRVVIAVPTDASPGQHLASLVVENADLFGGEGAVQAQERLRQVIAVLITVPGPTTPAFHLGAGKHSVVGKHSIVRVNLTNTGNVLVKPAGSMSIKDSAGSEVASTSVEMGSLYAGDSADLEVPLASALQPGAYTASWDLKDGATGATAKGDVPFAVTPAETAQAHTATNQTLPQVHQAVKRPVEVTARGDRGGSRSPFILIGGAVLILGAATALFFRRRRRAAGGVDGGQ